MSDPLHQYKKKRSFSDTPEPKNNASVDKEKSSFVIQKHQATHLHYDLRLQIGKTLKSWVLPKGVPKSTKEKHLAIQVEDHPLSYIHFEGSIPKGHYGAGKVEIWDKGNFCSIKKTREGNSVSVSKSLKDGHMEIILYGKKLKGPYALIHYREDKWLLIKMKKKT